MTRFQWADPTGFEQSRDAVGTRQEIEADRVEFVPGFVIFRDRDQRILRGVRSDRVDELVQRQESDLA